MPQRIALASKGRIRARWESHSLSEAEEVLADLKHGAIVGRAVLVP